MRFVQKNQKLHISAKMLIHELYFSDIGICVGTKHSLSLNVLCQYFAKLNLIFPRFYRITRFLYYG
jgi:hypothetical protein